MNDTPGDPTGLVDQIVAGEGVSVVRTDQPDEVALRVMKALDAQLVDTADDMRVAIEQRLDALRARTQALAALELHARLRDAADDTQFEVSSTQRLRSLVDRIDQANALVGSSRDVLRDRLGSGMGMALHPDALRAAASDVASARAVVEGLEAKVTALQHELDAAEAELLAELDLEAEESRARAIEPTWDDDERRMVIFAATALGVGLIVAIGGVVAVGSAFGFLLPLVAGVWLAMLLLRHRDDASGLDAASENLAAVAALTDRAYGGGIDRPTSPELEELHVQLRAAGDRLRYAEGAWVGLVGRDVPVEDLDELLRASDPNHHVDDTDLAQTPTMRAAQAHVRRLTAQWKVAWYALDRPVPALAQASVAIDALEEEGIERITVPTYEVRSAERHEAEARFDEIAAGRTVDELRAEASRQPAPLVVIDVDRSITEADIEARTAVLPKHIRVVFVTSSPEDED